MLWVILINAHLFLILEYQFKTPFIIYFAAVTMILKKSLSRSKETSKAAKESEDYQGMVVIYILNGLQDKQEMRDFMVNLNVIALFVQMLMTMMKC